MTFLFKEMANAFGLLTYSSLVVFESSVAYLNSKTIVRRLYLRTSLNILFSIFLNLLYWFTVYFVWIFWLERFHHLGIRFGALFLSRLVQSTLTTWRKIWAAISELY